ncbi:MAG: DNA mismatch repair protein MutS [Pirellulales bacterium]
MAPTPMMQQYHEAKQACGDALLLFRMGDFYELFFEDAKTAAKVLGLTLTSREKGENPIPMAGFPYHQLEGYLARLIRAGYRAAVCEQVEDPKKAQGLVKREVTRVVTAGTLTDDALLDPRESNYLAAICESSGKGGGRTGKAANDERVGIAWAELSTGRFYAADFPKWQLADQLARIRPAECLVSESQASTLQRSREMLVTSRPDWAFGLDSAQTQLTRHFQTKTLEGFGFTDDDSLAIRAAGAVLEYLRETQRTSLDHLDRLIPYRPGSTLEIDEATRRSLEITRTIREGRRDGSLLAVIDRTTTPMGSRLLADWLAAPLTDRPQIESRLDAVQDLLQENTLRDAFREHLRGTYDMERLLARVVTGRASPRDLSFVGRTLASLPPLKGTLANRPCQLLRELDQRLDLCDEVRHELSVALADDCPLSPRDGGFIRTGYSAELDQLRELATGGKQWIAQYQADEQQRTGIPNLKVGYNKVFGYYLEITNAHKDKTPPHYIRKQTIANAERYITPELKDYEEKVLTADERAQALEYDLFVALRDKVADVAHRLLITAKALAELDVLTALGVLARERGYSRPVLVDEPRLKILDGRHPVLDILEPAGTFVPNDTVAGEVVAPQSSTTADAESGSRGSILLITGPNMAGKSTYIRQVALLTLMAQIGSFVPAKRAEIGIADRIFARVGASDELSRGQSTFMVEMTETARILNTATPKSLVILDEIGRGTSTYDGVSLAWAIVEYLHDHIGCRTLFATHYHELTDLAKSLGGVKNLNVAVKEWEDNVVFLHKIIEGAADKSYGIHVARLAGVPREVNERAKQILAQLESEHLGSDGRPKVERRPKERKRGDIQLTLFAPYDHPLLDKIRGVDVNSLTPLQALQLVQQWQADLKSE